MSKRVTESYDLDMLGLFPLSNDALGLGDMPGWFPFPAMGGGLTFLDRMRRGEYIPAFLNEQMLSISRKRVRQLVVNNEIATNVVSTHVAYAIGEGFKYEVTPKDPRDQFIADETQILLDAFVEHNELGLREAETLSRVLVDGECFIRLFPSETGVLRCRFVEPECVKSPTGGNDDGSSFGVQTSMTDVEAVKGYWVVETPSGYGERPVFVDAAEVVHFKHPETPSCSKRGLSAFYATEGTIRSAEDLLHATVTLAKSRAKIAMLRKLRGASSDVASQLVAQQADYTATNPATNQTENIERYPDGTVLTQPESVEIEFPASNISAGDHSEVYQMVLRTIAARFSMPEYLLTSDASNGSYSSTLVAESPFVKAMQRLQDCLGRLLGKNRYPGPRQSIMWRQIAYAVKIGILPANTMRRIDIQVTGPTLTVRDLDKESRINKTYLDMGAKSLKTIQQEIGLDPDIEEQNNAEAAQKKAAMAPQQPQAPAAEAGQQPSPDAGQQQQEPPQ